LRAITGANVKEKAIKKHLIGADIRVSHLERVTPTLEDVFLALAAKERGTPILNE